MRRSSTSTLVFLGTCLAFAESTLGTIVTLTDADATLVAAFALVALGMVLTALVVMYWREPAFLTFSGEQALDLRKFEALTQNLPPDLTDIYSQEAMLMLLSQSREFGSTIRNDAPAGETDELDEQFNELISDIDQDVNEVD